MLETEGSAYIKLVLRTGAGYQYQLDVSRVHLLTKVDMEK